jgi:FkbH-like protein
MKLKDALSICHTPAPEGGREFRVALACGFTPLHLSTFLRAHLRQRLPDRNVVIETGSFGDLLGNLERAAEADVGAAVVVLEWPDLDTRLGIRQLGGWTSRDVTDIGVAAAARFAAIEKGLTRLAVRTPVTVLCPPTLPLPPIGPHGSWVAAAWELELYERSLAFAARASRLPGLKVAGIERLAQGSRVSDRYDVKSELLAGFPYTVGHTSNIAELAARILAPTQPKKGLITDLDDTFWKGLVGEAGPEGVTWDLDDQAQIHGVYQQLLAALADQGVLIAIASKNERAIAEAALGRSDLILRGDVPFPREIHWDAKSESVGRILRTWNVDAASTVMVDDSLAELEEVKMHYPEIECVHFPRRDYQAAYETILRLRDLFGKDSVTEEDRLRALSIRQSAMAQDEVRAAGVPQDEFLAQAGPTVKYTLNIPDARAVELINKTNQFNLNGRRYTESEWAAYLRDPEVQQIVVSYRDKYGPLGKIAVLTGRQQRRGFRVENWVMSCRAFSRRIEYHSLGFVFKTFGAEVVELEFRSTEKNIPMQKFLDGGFCRKTEKDCRISRKVFQRHCPQVVQQFQMDP